MLGALSAATGPFADQGRAVTAGNELYWKALNARGGVAGRYRVKLDLADTQYFESVAVIKYDEMHARVAAFNQVFGTKAVLAVLPRLRRDDVLAAPAAHDGRFVYEPQLIPWGPPPEVEAANAVAYWKAHGDGGPFCSLHQDDTYGTAGYQGAVMAGTKLGVPIAAAPTFPPLPPGFGPQVDALQSAGCKAVLFIGLPYQAGPALAEASRRGYEPRWLLTSASWSRSLSEQPGMARYLADHVWVLGSGPAWGDDSVAGMRSLVAARQRYRPDLEPSREVVEGYLQSAALHQVLERAVAKSDLSRGGLAEAASSLGKMRFDGLSGDYRYPARANDREPPRDSTIFAVDPSTPGGLRVVDRGLSLPTGSDVKLPSPPG